MRVLKLARRAAVAGLIWFAGGGCGSCGAPSGGPSEVGAVVPVDPPVPAPAGLLAEVWVCEPDAAWGRIQRGVSGAVALLPPGVGELVSAFAGLDPSVARLVDGKGTSYIVLGEGSGAEPVAWAAAMPVLDEAGASATLFGGADAGGARYVARDLAGMRVLSSAARPPRVTVALAHGVAPRGWLVVASGEEALALLGPYAVRTLPTKPAPSDAGAVVAEVPASSLSGPLSGALSARWSQMRGWLVARDDEQRAKHGGRAPDFGDPRPIVDALDGRVTRAIALLTAGRGAHVVFDAGDDEVHVEVGLTPGLDAASAAQLASMTPGDTAPLAASRADSAVTLLVRDGPEARAADAASLEAVLDKALGERLHDEDVRAIHAAMTDWVHARGDWWSGGLAWGAGDGSRGLWLRSPATSADASLRAVRELVDLSHRRPFQDLLAGSLHLSPADVRSAEAPPLGKVSVALFGDRAPGGNRKPDSAATLGVAWGLQGDDLLVAAGPSPTLLLAAETAPPRRVGDDPRSARALAALGQQASFAVFSEPLRLDATRPESDSSAPAVFAWGRKGDVIWGRIELADILLRELLRLKAGL